MAEGPQSDPTRSVLAALGANAAIAVVKTVAAVLTGSAALFAEAAHSLADTGNEILLLVGIRRSRREPDRLHPFGYGRERFFFGFMVAVSLFTIGGTYSVYHGVLGLVEGSEPPQAGLALAVVVVAAIFEGSALRVSWRQFSQRRAGGGLWHDLRTSTEPELLTTLGEDTAALAGLAIAAAGITLSAATGSGAWDSAASVGVGLVLWAVAVLLGRESRDLLLGESASGERQDEIRRAVLSRPSVDGIVELWTVHVAPDQLLVALELRFRDDLTTDDLELAVDDVEAAVREVAPDARWIMVEPELRRAGQPA